MTERQTNNIKNRCYKFLPNEFFLIALYPNTISSMHFPQNNELAFRPQFRAWLKEDDKPRKSRLDHVSNKIADKIDPAFFNTNLTLRSGPNPAGLFIQA